MEQDERISGSYISSLKEPSFAGYNDDNYVTSQVPIIKNGEQPDNLITQFVNQI